MQISQPPFIFSLVKYYESTMYINMFIPPIYKHFNFIPSRRMIVSRKSLNRHYFITNCNCRQKHLPSYTLLLLKNRLGYLLLIFFNKKDLYDFHTYRIYPVSLYFFSLKILTFLHSCDNIDVTFYIEGSFIWIRFLILIAEMKKTKK